MGGLAQNVQKTPPGKNVPKSQGQIFQECQGQIPKVKFPKVKYFRNAKVKFPKVKFPKVKWENKNVPKSQGQIFQEFVECVECQEF